MLPRMYVSRPRLLESLARATHCKLTIVCADAGYGKTSLVMEFIRSSDLRSEWYQLAGTDRDVARLAEGLEVRLRRLATGMEPTEASRTPPQQGRAHDLQILSEVLLRQAAQVGPEPALLVLDDYQAVNQEDDVNSLLSSLIENSSPCLHFLVLSRCVPRFSLAKLRARQEICILGEEDLAFRIDETGRFLSGEDGPRLDEGAIALVQERTEGWPAGIAMVSQSLRYGSQDKVMRVLSDPAASAWLVYDYLAEEVFDRQRAPIRDFLVKTSILATMNSTLCDYLLGITSSQRTLLALEEGGLFTASVNPSRQTFRYHQLFREFLRQKLHQLESADTVRGLHLRAAQFYEAHGEWEDCVYHYLKAGEPATAAQVVETIGEKQILAGFFQTVDRWLQALPEDLTSTRPWLIVLRAQLGHMSVRNEEALRLLERALRIFQTSGDEEGEARTLGEIAFVRYRSHQIRQAIRYYELALAKAEGNSSLKASIAVGLPSPYRYGGMLGPAIDACRRAAEEAEGILEEVRRLQIQTRATRHRAMVLMERGDLEAARRAGQQALEMGSTCDLGEYERSWTLVHLGTVLWACGDFEECIEAMNRALDMSGRHIRQIQEKIGSRLGNALRDSGRIAEAERFYALGGWEADFERAFLSVLTHDSRAAWTRARALYDQWHLSENMVARSSAEVILAAALRESDEAARALEHIREAVRLLEAGGYRFRLAGALLHQARLEYELSLEEARDTLDRAFQLAAANNYYHFFWWDPELVTFLCKKAFEEGIAPEYAFWLASQRLGANRAGALAHLPLYRRMEMREPSGNARNRDAKEPSGEPLAELLVGCPDPQVRSYLLQALADGVISPEGLHTLRADYGLTWREVEVLVEYYLRPAIQPNSTGLTLRMSCARRLGISKNTVRCHVSSIRGKLSLPSSLSGRGILAWVELQGLLPSANSRRGSFSSLQQVARRAGISASSLQDQPR